MTKTSPARRRVSVPSSIATCSVPASTYSGAGTRSCSVWAMGLTCSLHFQPGSNHGAGEGDRVLDRDEVDRGPLTKSRTSSGASSDLFAVMTSAGQFGSPLLLVGHCCWSGAAGRRIQRIDEASRQARRATRLMALRRLGPCAARRGATGAGTSGAGRRPRRSTCVPRPAGLGVQLPAPVGEWDGLPSSVCDRYAKRPPLPVELEHPGARAVPTWSSWRVSSRPTGAHRACR